MTGGEGRGVVDDRFGEGLVGAKGGKVDEGVEDAGGDGLCRSKYHVVRKNL